jgi:Putative peptidoglycan binding domain
VNAGDRFPLVAARLWLADNRNAGEIVILCAFSRIVGCSMKKSGLLSCFAISALIGLSQPAHGGSGDRSEGYSYPSDATYESHGTVRIVRQVQLALEEDGYYVGDNHGNYCYETRVAVRRYQRDNRLPVTGKIDSALLKTLGLR